MSGLVLSLRPNEKFLVNGTMLQNGDRRSQIRVESDEANILRLSDAIHPKDVTTPVQRVYYHNQLIITGDKPAQEGMAAVITGIEELHHAFVDSDARAILEKARNLLLEKKYYSVLTQLKRLLPLEQALLAEDEESENASSVTQEGVDPPFIANLR